MQRRIGALGKRGTDKITKIVIGIGAVGLKPNQFEGSLYSQVISFFLFKTCAFLSILMIYIMSVSDRKWIANKVL